MGLSISSVGSKQSQYYVDAVAKGREDYYSGHGEAPPTEFKGRTDSQWEAPRRVSAEEASEKWSLRGEDDHRKVVAFDLTFSAPKSVSVLWATADAETRATIEKTHRLAMEAAVGSMEWYSREGHAGASVIRTGEPDGMFDFRHRTSRALDPQLHSHLLVPNAVTVGDKTLTLDGREVYAQGKNAGMIYDAVLRRGLTEELGVAWEPMKATGASGDIRGVSKELIAFWSTRRAEIEGQLDEWRASFEAETGRAPTAAEARKAAEGFTLSTREKKVGTHETADLLDRWGSEADAIQANVLTEAQTAAQKWAQAQVGSRADLQNRLVGAVSTKGSAEKALIASMDGQTTPTLNRWQLAVEARKLLPQRENESVEKWNGRVSQLVEQVTTSGALVALPDTAGSPRGERFTTQAHLAKEIQTINTLGRDGHFGRAGRNLSAATRAKAQEAVDSGRLSQEQAKAIVDLADAETTGAVLIGAPGVGKTTALGVLADGASASGWTVTGLAATGKAAREVNEAAERGGGKASTIATWVIEKQHEAGVETQAELLDLWKNGHPERGDHPKNELIFLDETSLTSTDDLSKISTYAQFSGAKVVLVGDHRQIGAVDKGGLLLAVATAKGDEAERLGLSKIPTATIETVVRQKEEWERRAAEDLRAGGKRAEQAVEAYAEKGRIHAVEGTLEAKKEIAQRMADDLKGGKASIAIGYTGSAVNQLNAAVVNELVSRGELPEQSLPDFKFRAGQQVITRSNVYLDEGEGRKLVVANGDRWTVVEQVGKGKHAELVIEKLGSGERRKLDKEYVEGTINGGGKKLQSGYATTPTSIQSASLDGSSYTLASEHASAESVLVPMTRGKEENHIYVAVGESAKKLDPLIATTEQTTADQKAVDWMKSKTLEAPAENDKAAVQHLSQAAERTAAIEAARQLAELEAARQLAAEQARSQGFGRS